MASVVLIDDPILPTWLVPLAVSIFDGTASHSHTEAPRPMKVDHALVRADSRAGHYFDSDGLCTGDVVGAGAGVDGRT